MCDCVRLLVNGSYSLIALLERDTKIEKMPDNIHCTRSTVQCSTHAHKLMTIAHKEEGILKYCTKLCHVLYSYWVTVQ